MVADVPSGYVRRFLDDEISDALRVHPAVLVVGPRASGKTTTARRHAATVVRLDRPAESAAFIADADAALATFEEPVLLDEWQAVPGLLGAVKRAVDDDSRPGRFILTGSIRADLKGETWPGTGRLVRLDMWGISEREIAGFTEAPSLLSLIVEHGLAALSPPRSPPDLVGYIELALRGGFPDAALRLENEGRYQWLDSYLDQVLTRDAVDVSRRDPALLARYFEVLALNSAGIVTDNTIFEAAAIDRRTAAAYERLLSNLFLLDVVPAWFTNRLSRLVKTPKRYITDASLVAAALRIDVRGVLRDGDILGRALDTFVASQLRPELNASGLRPRLFHLREKNGRHEIDLLAELSGNRVIAFEVKASAAPNRSDAAHLEWLRDRLGERFIGGVVLHTGPSVFALSDRIVAAPLASLWTPHC